MAAEGDRPRNPSPCEGLGLKASHEGCEARLFTAVVFTIAALLSAGRAPAQARPYFAQGTAQLAANQSDFTGSGTATHLGKYIEVGNVTFTATGTPGVLAVNGWAHYTAANGDVLCAVISGTVDLASGGVR